MILRQAELKDKKAILEIANLLYLNIPEFVWNNDNFITRQIEKGEYFLIEENGAVAGIMSLRQRKSGMHIETLAVKKEFQARGFGTKFIEFAKSISQEREADNLYAYSFREYNIADFYLKKGFKLLKYAGYYKRHQYNCFGIEVRARKKFSIKELLNTQTNSISWASFILAGSYLSSATLGLLRDHLLTNKLGAGNELDVYYTAFTIPDFIALILFIGAISAAIVPIFSSYYSKSKDEAWEYVSALLNTFLLFLIVVCVILVIFTPFLISLIAPGFSEAKRDAAILLMRIMFLSPIILGLSNMVSGILQVFHRFLATALAPIMYNAGIIIGILFFLPIFGLLGVVLGVILGAIMHLLIQAPAFFYSGFSYLPAQAGQKIFNFKHPGVVKTLKLMAPRSLGLGAGQFNTIITTAIASTLAAGSIAVFNLANNLSSFLVNAVAISISTAVFPAMTLAHAKEDKKDFEKKFSGAFLQLMFLTIPASVLVFILRAQIVRVIYGSGRFGWMDTRLTAACLGIFSISLFAQGLILILSKTFYAAHNTKVPAIISVATVAFNIAASFFFIWLIGASAAFLSFLQYILKLQGISNISIVGLAIAFSLTAIIESGILLWLVYKKLKIFRARGIALSLFKIIISAAAMLVAAFFVRQFLVVFSIVKLETFWGVFLQLAISAAAGGIAGSLRHSCGLSGCGNYWRR